MLTLYIRNNKLTIAAASKIAKLAEEFMSEREFQVDSETVFNLVSSSGCSSYDCEFDALAQSLNLPLYTSDIKIVDKFPTSAKLLKDI